jgi:hypothetical protein
MNAGRGESGLSEKGEKAEIRALADDGGLNGDLTAIIMASYATQGNVGAGEGQVTKLPAAGGAFAGATRLVPQAKSRDVVSLYQGWFMRREKGSYHAWVCSWTCLSERCKAENAISVSAVVDRPPRRAGRGLMSDDAEEDHGCLGLLKLGQAPACRDCARGGW